MTNDALLRALGWALAHAIWQALAIAFLLLILLPRLQTARQRYWVSYSALLAVFMAAVGTFIWMYEPVHPLAGSLAYQVDEPVENTFLLLEYQALGAGFWQKFTVWLETNHTMIVAIWLLGFGFFLLRLGGGLWQVRRLRTRGVTLPEGPWLEIFNQIRHQLGYNRVVTLLESTLVNTPIAIGWLKPVVLLPIGLVNRLSVAEVEAVLAHELAHIARRDWLFNLIQAFIESIFYYHPAVWWMSGVVRSERENCCDDAALAATGNPLAFAKALVQVQEMATPAPALALAMSGANPRPLLNRVRRILNQPQQRQQQVMEKITATVILLALLALVGLKANSVPAIEAVFAQMTDLPTTLFNGPKDDNQMVSDSVPKPKSTQKITREADDQRVEAEYQNGILIRLNIDGKEIPVSEFNQHEALAAELLEDMEPPAPPTPPTPPNGIWFEAPEAPERPERPEMPERGHGYQFYPGVPTPPFPPMPQNIRVISDKDSDGNTVIRFDNNGDATEVVVKNNELYINGKKLEKGAELIIPGAMGSGEHQFFFSEDFDPKDAPEFGEKEFLFFHTAPEERAAYLQGFSKEHKAEMERAMEESKRAYSDSKRDYERQMKAVKKELERSQREMERSQKTLKQDQKAWEKDQEKYRAEERAWAKKAKAIEKGQ